MAHNEFLAVYGTEFENLDDEEKDHVPRRPTAVQDQIATDTEGRRRFHGAFTGGFSAGYYNTAGSKQGWTPSDFRSSRDERAEAGHKQRAEDFMDEEDLGEFGISSRRIRQSSTFSGGQKEKRKMAWEHDGTQGALASHIESVVRPVSDSIGIRMLRRMGWRQGRGVGLATEKEKRDKDRISEVDRAQMVALGRTVDLSAEDEDIVHMEPVEGTRGLGYIGLTDTNVLNERFGQKESTYKNKGSKGRGIKGQAFGVGAFEDDDESVYSSHDLSQYDFALEGPGKAPQAPTLDSTFVTSSRRVAPRKFFPPPTIPSTFRGMHKVEKVDEKHLPANVREGLQKLNPLLRAKLLGEDRTSVMELVSDADRNRLTSKSRKSRWSIKKEEAEAEPESNFDRIEFPDEPMKQKRFKEYLYYLRIGHVYPQPTDMSFWEWENERKEFESKLTHEERAMLPEVRSRTQPLAQSSLAMPLQELLQSKFVTEKGDETTKAFTKDEDKMAAVKMGIFGEKTRTTHEWHPHKTLTKLFNVPNPFPHASYVGCAHLQKNNRKETLLNLGLPNTASELAFNEERRKNNRSATDEKDSRVKREPIDPEQPSTSAESDVPEVEWERPPADLFAAIFADSDSEDEDEEDAEKEKERKEYENKIEVAPAIAEYELVEDEEERVKGEERERQARRDQWNKRKEEPGSTLEEPTTPPLPIDIKNEKCDDDDAIEVVNVDIGPQPPPMAETHLSADTILRYLQEDLEKAKKEKKHKKHHHHHKTKKDKKDKKKKSKKDKKVKKSKKAKKEGRDKDDGKTRRRSASESSGSVSTVTLSD